MIVSISVAVIAVAVVVLVMYAIRVLKTLNNTLLSVNNTITNVKQSVDDTIHRVQETITRVEHDFDEIQTLSVSVLKETELLTADLRRKSEQFEHLFSSIKEVGDTVHHVSNVMAQQANRHRDELGHLLALTSFGMEVWQKWKDMRNRKQKTVEGRE